MHCLSPMSLPRHTFLDPMDLHTGTANISLCIRYGINDMYFYKQTCYFLAGGATQQHHLRGEAVIGPTRRRI
jgi:hypothetical protein